MEREKKPTREQLIAQASDRHLSLTANAGSGKTYVLENRCVDLLLDEKKLLSPRDIAAITFTKKAASEIYSRISTNIEEKIKEKRQSRDKLDRLQVIRERLHSTRISTIHSFCSSILRDYPVEAGVQPNFRELSEADRIRIMNDSIQEALAVKIDEDEKTRDIIRVYGKDEIIGFLKALLTKRDVLFRAREFYKDLTVDELSDKLSEAFLEFFAKKYSRVFKELSSAFETAADCVSKEKTSGNLRHLSEELAGLDFSDLSTKNAEDFFLSISMIIEKMRQLKILKSDFKLFKKVSDDLIESRLDICEKANSLLKEFETLKKYIDAWENRDKQKETIEHSRVIHQVAMETEEIMRDYKLEASGLDFEDLLILAKKVLDDEKTAKKIRSEIKYLLVDEFQDTNKIQYDIIKRLTPELEGKTDLAQSNLFIVGDSKQSIYGFRNADVRVFNEAADEIVEVNKRKLNDGEISNDFKTSLGREKPKSETEAAGKIELTVSFRHKNKPVIPAIADEICETIMSVGDSEFEAEYSPFVCFVDEEEFFERYKKGESPIDLNEGDLGDAEFLLTIPDEENNEAPSEAENLTKRIIELTEGNSDLDYKDVAVLARSKTRIGELVTEFQKNGVPYVLTAGKEFYQSQEVVDIISILKFLYNRQDELSLAAALKSPYFGLSETDLYLIKKSGDKKATLWEKLKSLSENNSDFSGNIWIKRAKDILEELSRFASILAIPCLIRKIIERCGWYGAVSESPSKEQAEANLTKLTDYAREFEARGFNNLFDFVEEIDLINRESVSESEAPLQTEDDAVKVTTIHAAKGLEFDVVALYDLNSGKGNKGSYFVDDDYGLVFDLKSLDPEFGAIKKYKTPANFFFGKRQEDAENAEEKRILYVAMTRAKKRLIFSAKLKRGKNSFHSAQGLFSLILDGLGENPDSLAERKNLDIERELKAYDGNEVKTFDAKFSVDIVTEVGSGVAKAKEADKPAIQPELVLDSIETSVENEVYSATQFLLFNAEDKTDFVARYKLGFPDSRALFDTKVGFETESESDNEPEARATGSAFHYAMENMDLWISKEGEINEESLKIVTERGLAKAGVFYEAEVIDSIADEIRSTVSTRFIKKNLTRILESEKEYKLYYPLNGDFLVAQIDLLTRDGDTYEIWDWKTGAVANKDEMKRAAANYELQMKIYSYLLSKMNAGEKEYKAKLLFTKLAGKEKSENEWIYDFRWDESELRESEKELKREIKKIKSF